MTIKKDTQTHTRSDLAFLLIKPFNSSPELMHASSRSEVNWFYELINTANDRPQLIKGSFTGSMIWAQLPQLPPDLLSATSSQLVGNIVFVHQLLREPKGHWDVDWFRFYTLHTNHKTCFQSPSEDIKWCKQDWSVTQTMGLFCHLVSVLTHFLYLYIHFSLSLFSSVTFFCRRWTK